MATAQTRTVRSFRGFQQFAEATGKWNQVATEDIEESPTWVQT